MQRFKSVKSRAVSVVIALMALAVTAMPVLADGGTPIFPR